MEDEAACRRNMGQLMSLHSYEDMLLVKQVLLPPRSPYRTAAAKLERLGKWLRGHDKHYNGNEAFARKVAEARADGELDALVRQWYAQDMACFGYSGGVSRSARHQR